MIPGTEVKTPAHVEEIARSVFRQHGIQVAAIQILSAPPGWQVVAARPVGEDLVLSVFSGTAAQVRERMISQIQKLL